MRTWTSDLDVDKSGVGGVMRLSVDGRSVATLHLPADGELAQFIVDACNAAEAWNAPEGVISDSAGPVFVVHAGQLFPATGVGVAVYRDRETPSPLG